MKNLSLLLLIAGLIAGPAYWVYAKFYTGSQAALLKLDRAGTGWRSADFRLSPDMAPVGLILHATGSFSPNMHESQPPKDGYAVTLFRDGQAAKPLNISLGVKNVADSNPAFKEHLLFFQVVQAGTYHVEISPAAEPDIKLDRMELEVRQHLHEPDSTIVTAGMVVMILGILGFFL
ncbi:MAG: hypothetical protein AB1899_13440 [Pseudomonadota bacterium]